ncbi:hypothetical protein [Reticulibacter mediterranei]|uniref:hypothetical protein n=1 Tax=Reticulibacter mediterranei TaxID=2778369 RepID=UPI001C694172|nr:hypothetical protein [Reticulibacter mediterranei]
MTEGWRATSARPPPGTPHRPLPLRVVGRESFVTANVGPRVRMGKMVGLWRLLGLYVATRDEAAWGGRRAQGPRQDSPTAPCRYGWGDGFRVDEDVGSPVTPRGDSGGRQAQGPAKNAPPPLAATGGGEGIVCYGKCGATRTDGRKWLACGGCWVIHS